MRTVFGYGFTPHENSRKKHRCPVADGQPGREKKNSRALWARSMVGFSIVFSTNHTTAAAMDRTNDEDNDRRTDRPSSRSSRTQLNQTSSMRRPGEKKNVRFPLVSEPTVRIEAAVRLRESFGNTPGDFTFHETETKNDDDRRRSFASHFFTGSSSRPAAQRGWPFLSGAHGPRRRKLSETRAGSDDHG